MPVFSIRRASVPTPTVSGAAMRADRERFEAQVLPELPVLYRMASRLTSTAELAEDVVGQTLLNAARGWHGFDGQHVRSWLIQILRRVAIDVRTASAKPDSATSSLELEVELVATKQDVHQEAEIKLTQAELVKAVDALPESFRLVVMLCDVEQMSYEEAALALEIPVGTVRSRLFRARRQLRDALSAWEVK